MITGIDAKHPEHHARSKEYTECMRKSASMAVFALLLSKTVKPDVAGA